MARKRHARNLAAGGNRRYDLIADGRSAGFTLVEVLLGLAVLSVLLPLALSLVKTTLLLHKSPVNYYQDEIGVYQLQQELAVNDILEVEADHIKYRTSENVCTLHIVNGNLISQPGTYDFIHGIGDADFEVDDGVIYLNYEREGHDYRWPLGYYAP